MTGTTERSERHFSVWISTRLARGASEAHQPVGALGDVGVECL